MYHYPEPIFFKFSFILNDSLGFCRKNTQKIQGLFCNGKSNSRTEVNFQNFFSLSRGLISRCALRHLLGYAFFWFTSFSRSCRSFVNSPLAQTCAFWRHYLSVLSLSKYNPVLFKKIFFRLFYFYLKIYFKVLVFKPMTVLDPSSLYLFYLSFTALYPFNNSPECFSFLSSLHPLLHANIYIFVGEFLLSG